MKPLPIPIACIVLPSRGIVVELSFSDLAADCLLSQCLGFNLASSSIFFCFRHHHTYTVFSLRYYVMVILALRVPSISVSLLHSFALCVHTSFPICLLKFSCNSYPMSTCLMTNTLRVLEPRVFLHYLIKKDYCDVL